MAMVFGRNYYHALGGGGIMTPRSGASFGALAASRNSESAAAEALSSPSTIRKSSLKTLILDDEDESQITQVDASAQSTVFLTSAGRVYQTGTLHGHVYPSPTRVTVPLPIPAVQISCGRHFCLALMQGGVVVSWGAGHFGQLGIGATADGGGLEASDHQQHASAASLTFASTPVVIERLLPHIVGSPIVRISAGDWHALALTQSGRVWAWGSNRSYQCGRKPTSSNTTAPTLTAPLPVPIDGTVMDIGAGRSHSVALLSPMSSVSTSTAGQVLAWGASHYGQCGLLRRAGSGVVPPRFVEGLAEVTIERISAGGNHTLALSTGGRVFGWGSASEGELGLGVAVPAQLTPRLIGDLDFCAILAGQEWKSQIRQQLLQQQSANQPATKADADDPLAPTKAPIATFTTEPVGAGAWSASTSLQLSQVPVITKVACGPSYSAAISSSGHVYVWGSNDAGQLGITRPDVVPLRDSYVQGSKTTTNRDLHVQTFDSSHNVLLPTRLDAVRDMFVQHVACGPNHLWCVGIKRSAAQQSLVVGKTLYEVQEEQRLQKLQRARDSLLSKLHHLSEDPGATTEGTTTQTDDNDTIVESSSPSSHLASTIPRATNASPAEAVRVPAPGVFDSPQAQNRLSGSAFAGLVVPAGAFGPAVTVGTPSTIVASDPDTTPASHLESRIGERDVSTADVEDASHHATSEGEKPNTPPLHPETSSATASPPPPPAEWTTTMPHQRSRRFSLPWRRFSFGARANSSGSARQHASASNRAATSGTAPAPNSPSPATPRGGSLRLRRGSRFSV